MGSLEVVSIHNASGQCIEDWSAALRYVTMEGSPIVEQRLEVARMEPHQVELLKRGDEEGYPENEPLPIDRFAHLGSIALTDSAAAARMGSSRMVGYYVSLERQRWKPCGEPGGETF